MDLVRTKWLRWKDPRTKMENMMVELELNLAREAETWHMCTITICWMRKRSELVKWKGTVFFSFWLSLFLTQVSSDLLELKGLAYSSIPRERTGFKEGGWWKPTGTSLLPCLWLPCQRPVLPSACNGDWNQVGINKEMCWIRKWMDEGKKIHYTRKDLEKS